MRIVMIGTYSDKGGIQNHIHNLSCNLNKYEDIKIDIISISQSDCSHKLDEFTIHSIPIRNRFGIYYNESSQIIDKVEEIKPDIIHVHGTYLPYSKIIADLSKLKICPLVLTIHSSNLEEIKSRYSFPLRLYMYLKYVIESYYEKRSMKCANEIITVSESMKNIILKTTKEDSHITVIPNGIDVNLIDSIKTKLDLAHPSLLFVGRLVKVKGCDILIKSIGMVKEYYPDIKLYIIGEGSQQNSLRKLTKDLNLNDNISFRGYLSEKDKVSYINSVDICIYPSRFEAFGIVLLEAMACGKPIIASKIGGIKDILLENKTGYFFEVGSSSDLACKIMKMLEEKEKMRIMGVNARERAEKDYQWKLITAKTYEIYKLNQAQT